MILLTGRGASGAAAQTMLVRVLILGINILTGILSARLLGATGRGEQAVIAMWPQLIPLCLTLGLPTSLVYGARRAPQRECSLFAAAMVLAASVGLVASALGCLAVPYWLGHLDVHVVQWSQVLMLVVPFGMISPLGQSIMEAHSKFAIENALVFASALSTVCLLLAIGAAGVANPVTVAMAYTVGGLPAGIIGVAYAARLARPAVRDFAAAAQTLLHYGLRQYGSDLLSTLSGNVDQLLVASFLSSRMVGIYIVSASLCRALSLIQQSIVTVLFPRIVGQPLNAMSDSVQRAVRVNLVISLVPTLAIGFGGAKLIQLVYGHDFVANDVVIWLILGDTLLGGVSRLLGQTMMAVGRPGVVTLLNSAQFAICIPLALVLLPHYQAVGVATAMLAGTTFRLILMVTSYSLVLGLPRPQLIFSFSDLRFICARLLRAPG
ncbi:MAG TPA: oligosaccharide flippase family protein [Candidatus Binataceae bacterium]|nr:oligosaccharide flippase family protein [Candidatus Binataceae bacterium]